MFCKKIIKSDSDQSDVVYKESISERTKLRRQRLDKIKGKQQNINNKLFKHYFNYQSPSKMYETLSDPKSTKNHIRVKLIKSSLTDFKKTLKMNPKMM